jgi:hypothetical protein
MDSSVVGKQVQELLDDLTDDWFAIADERRFKYPVTFVVFGMHGQYLCGALERNGGDGYRLLAEHQSSSLFAEPPHHTVLIDAGGRATRLTKAPRGGPQKWQSTVE